MEHKKWFLTAILVALFGTLLITAPLAYTQATTYGQLRGQITDSSGALVANATITIKSNDTGVTKSVSTNNAGIYEFSFLSPGNYSITANAAGFRTITRNVSITLGSSVAADIQLQVGAANTTIESMEIPPHSKRKTPTLM